MLSALNTAGPLILDASALFPNWNWQIHALIGFIVFASIMTWMVIENRIELWHINNAKPNIVLKSIDENLQGNVITREFSSVISQTLYGETEHPNFTRIWIANEPMKAVQEVEACNIYGEITFYRDTGKNVLFTMGGRWAETKEIADGGQPIEIDQIVLPPNGRPFCMDIGLKYGDEDEFYGYNNETPRKNTKGFRDHDRKLDSGNYTVKLRLRCKGVDRSFWFQLKNGGAGQNVSLIPIDQLPSLCKEDCSHRR